MQHISTRSELKRK